MNTFSIPKFNFYRSLPIVLFFYTNSNRSIKSLFFATGVFLLLGWQVKAQNNKPSEFITYPTEKSILVNNIDLSEIQAYGDTICYGQTSLVTINGFPKSAWIEEELTKSIGRPSGVLGADLDGDGDLDMLVSSVNNKKISWYENMDGLGNFGGQHIITKEADGVWSADIGDIDGDGDLDVISGSSYDGKVAWYENLDGLGSFGDQQVIRLNAGWVNSVDSEDIDGDGDLDVLATLSSDDKIVWYENLDGKGGFGLEQIISATLDNPYYIDAIDIDGDGDLDVVSASNSASFNGKIVWHKNLNGSGQFEIQQVVTMDAYNAGSTSIAVGDLNGDLHPDILCSASGGNIVWFENMNGSGMFGSSQTVASNLTNIRTIGTGDIDGDGNLDVLSHQVNNTEVIWYKNTGLGNFDTGNIIPIEINNISSFFIDDIDGDQDSDILPTPSFWGYIPWYENLNAGSSFQLKQGVASDALSANSVDRGDLDGDGDLDVIFAASGGNIGWYSNEDGMGTFGLQKYISANEPSAYFAHPSDIDGDGDIDILSCTNRHQEYKIFWFENLDGMGNFGPKKIISTDITWTGDLKASDLDGDGDLDVLAASSFDDRIIWFENTDGNGTFGSLQIITTDVNYPSSIFLSDLDSDGDLDILSASSSDNKIAWYENIGGTGNFGAQQIIATDALGANTVVAEDVDSDGDLDVVSSSHNDQKIAWYENLDGEGSFGPSQIIASNIHGVNSIRFYDLDLDSDLDILAISSKSAPFYDEIGWVENINGLDSFSTFQVISENVDNAESLLAADLDNDGDLDIFSASSSDDKVAWFENVLELKNPISLNYTINNGMGQSVDNLIVTDESTFFSIPNLSPGINSIHINGIADANGNIYSVSIFASIVVSETMVSLGNDITLCQGEEITLNAASADIIDYEWSNGTTDSILTINQSDTVFVIVTNENGCKAGDTIVVNVNFPPVDLGPDDTSCDLPLLDASTPTAISYEWSTNETTPEIQPMQAGEYAVTVTDQMGCTASDTIVIEGLVAVNNALDTILCTLGVFEYNDTTFNQSGSYVHVLKSISGCDSIITQIVLEISNLNLDIGADIEACDLANNPFVLDAGIADFYSWSNGATSGTIQVNMPGTYACTVTDDLGCTQEDAVEVVEIPAFEITIDTAICTGESIIVGASTYSSTGNYTEQLTSLANCDSIVYLNLTVLPSLTQPAISGASEVCSGEAAIYQITNYDPALTYGWGLPNDATLLNNSGDQAEIQFGSLSGEVTVSVSNSCETVSSDVIMVAVGQATLPAPVFTGETTVCEGETIVYQIASFDPASTYDWELPNGAVIVAENGPDVSIQFAGNGGALSLTETNNCGESTAYPVVINVGAPPTTALPINGDVIICGSETATYSIGSVTGALAYQWTVNPGAFMQTTNSPTLDMDWALPGMYSLCVVAENDCGVSNQPQCLTVSVLELPQGQISGDTVLCGSGEVTLAFDLQGTGPWDITYSSGSAAYDIFGISSSPHTIVQPVSMPTTFELIKVQNGNGCIGVATGTFEVSIGQQTAISIDTVLCSDEEILINGSVYADSGCYDVTLPTLMGCDTVLTLCIDDADPFELLQVEQCEVPYIFNGKEIYESGTYEDTILHSATCSTFVVLDLEILPSADFEPIPDILSILNGTAPIDINLVENDQLPDSAPWYLSILSQPNNGVVNDVGNGTVSLTVTNSGFSGNDLFNYAICTDECPDTCKATTVSLMFSDDCIAEVVELGVFPKAFSPNGDGINDYFDPIQKFEDLQCPIDKEKTELLILNRWGEVIFKPAQYKAWDGKRNGGGSKSFPPATYYYVLKMKKLNGEEVVVKGPISIFEKK